MKKRGQVTTFIIVGIVVFIIILFLIFARDTVLTKISGEKGAENYLKTQMKAVDDEIKKCVNAKSGEALELLGKQGGYFKALNYVFYNGDKVSILCRNIEGVDGCLNRGLFNKDIENKLNLYMKINLLDCINLKDFKDGFKTYDYELNYDLNELDVNTMINEANILFKVSLPVEMKRDGVELDRDEFNKRVNVPFGKILVVVNDILNSEAESGDFDIVGYSMEHVNEYDISMSWRGRNKIYSVNIVNSDYIFRFAIEGENEV